MKYLYVILLGIFLSQPTSAHDWYDMKCCSTKDCHPIESCYDLNENDDGSYDYGHFHFSKEQVHPSQDNKCHVCIHTYEGPTGTHDMPMCVYVQQGA